MLENLSVVESFSGPLRFHRLRLGILHKIVMEILEKSLNYIIF